MGLNSDRPWMGLGQQGRKWSREVVRPWMEVSVRRAYLRE